MPTLIQLIDGEIPSKGKAYFILERYDEADFEPVMAAAFSKAEGLGATELHLASRTEAFPTGADGFEIDGRTFSFETNFWIMEKELDPKQCLPAAGSFRVKKLAPWNLELYIALYQECFFTLPNSRTLNREDGEVLLSDPSREAGFFMDGGAPAGIFELDYSDPVPEIKSVALLESYRGKGLGKPAMAFLEGKIADRGFTSCQVLVAEKNQSAMALYTACGYRKKQLLSTWYCHRVSNTIRTAVFTA